MSNDEFDDMEFNEEFYHVVPPGGTKRHWKYAAESRAILAQYGIDIDSVVNGGEAERGGPTAPRFGATQTGVYHKKILSHIREKIAEWQKQGYNEKVIAAKLGSELLTTVQLFVSLQLIGGSYNDEDCLPR